MRPINLGTDQGLLCVHLFLQSLKLHIEFNSDAVRLLGDCIVHLKSRVWDHLVLDLHNQSLNSLGNKLHHPVPEHLLKIFKPVILVLRGQVFELILRKPLLSAFHGSL